MSNTMRLVRGDPRIIKLSKLATDRIELGDLLFWDSSNAAVRPAEQVSGSDYATKQTNFAGAFVGVAMAAADAGAGGDIPVATSGDFLYPAPSGTGTAYDVAAMVGVGNGTAISNQIVVKTTTAGASIGRVISPKTTSQAFVMVRIAPKINQP
jgi:hypothetical protein